MERFFSEHSGISRRALKKIFNMAWMSASRIGDIHNIGALMVHAYVMGKGSAPTIQED
jgi:hypothetical protein